MTWPPKLRPTTQFHPLPLLSISAFKYLAITFSCFISLMDYLTARSTSSTSFPSSSCSISVAFMIGFESVIAAIASSSGLFELINFYEMKLFHHIFLTSNSQDIRKQFFQNHRNITDLAHHLSSSSSFFYFPSTKPFLITFFLGGSLFFGTFTVYYLEPNLNKLLFCMAYNLGFSAMTLCPTNQGFDLSSSLTSPMAASCFWPFFSSAFFSSSYFFCFYSCFRLHYYSSSRMLSSFSPTSYPFYFISINFFFLNSRNFYQIACSSSSLNFWSSSSRTKRLLSRSSTSINAFLLFKHLISSSASISSIYLFESQVLVYKNFMEFPSFSCFFILVMSFCACQASLIGQQFRVPPSSTMQS